MKFSTSGVLSLAGLMNIAAVSANFDLYYTQILLANGPLDAYTAFAGEPSCDQVNNGKKFYRTGDVSGSPPAARCEGSGCINNIDPSLITEFELHASDNPDYHWTLYKDRGYTMTGVDGNVYGECILFPGDTVACGVTNSYRKFRCLTQFTADQINSGD